MALESVREIHNDDLADEALDRAVAGKLGTSCPCVLSSHKDRT
jgi:hypothetical protein